MHKQVGPEHIRLHLRREMTLRQPKVRENPVDIVLFKNPDLVTRMQTLLQIEVAPHEFRRIPPALQP